MLVREPRIIQSAAIFLNRSIGPGQRAFPAGGTQTDLLLWIGGR